MVVGPRSVEPSIRVGLGIGLARIQIGGGAPLIVSGRNHAVRAQIPKGGQVEITSAGTDLRVSGSLSWSPAASESLTFSPVAPDDYVQFGAREYRGVVTIFLGRNGLTAVNRLGLESYLAGVVSSEMGRRDSTEIEALLAQAVVSRTYAQRNRGRWEALGFDFYASVVDQVYGGVGAETAIGWHAVRATAGQVVTWHGAPIDAFFFSTCGGKTAQGTEVFAGADRPYLLSIDDIDPNGLAYCRISPRFDWRTEWSGEGLRDILRESVPAALGTSLTPGAVIQSVRVAERSSSGRVSRLALSVDGREIAVTGAAVRQVLRPSRGEILRSGLFTLSETMSHGSISRLVAEGHGAGHGVGMCQWGAVGRARAGQAYTHILAAYFPDTDIERIY
ncbi:MAG: SpoIID/LytB domain-containing protein [Gemmatimonadota bacterium]